MKTAILSPKQFYKNIESKEVYFIGKDQKRSKNLINTRTGSEYFLPFGFNQKLFEEYFKPTYPLSDDIRPTKEHKPIFNAVMKLLENSPKRFENETEIENLINKALQ